MTIPQKATGLLSDVLINVMPFLLINTNRKRDYCIISSHLYFSSFCSSILSYELTFVDFVSSSCNCLLFFPFLFLFPLSFLYFLQLISRIASYQSEMLKGFSGDKSQLGNAEKFLLAVISVNGYGYLFIVLSIY